MQLNELDNFNLGDAIYFHDELNPALFDGDKMKDRVREQLLLIAEDFVDHLGINNLDITDITISGSNAAYSYTRHSDIDLHILVDMSKFNDDDVYRELFDAKKTVYNDSHDITIDGYEVELYVQDTNQPVISLGEYSILHNSWNRLPRKRRAHVDQIATKLKYEKLIKLGSYAYKTNSAEKIKNVLRTIKKYRQAGLDLNGEFGPENLAFKIMRKKGLIKKLYDKLQDLHDERLSLPESVNEEKEPLIMYHVTPTRNLPFIKRRGLIPTMGSRSSQIEHEVHGVFLFPDKISAEDAVMNWLGDQFDEDEDLAMLAVNVSGLEDSIQAGAEYEKISTVPIEPSRIKVIHTMLECSGYIPSVKQKNDPRFKTALTVDITPYSIQDNARKLGSKIKRDGRPPLLRA